ncbi:MAG TPA: hypothetical protein V6D34_10690 [Candidatus Sericytochromatia bacterium]
MPQIFQLTGLRADLVVVAYQQRTSLIGRHCDRSAEQTKVTQVRHSAADRVRRSDLWLGYQVAAVFAQL